MADAEQPTEPNPSPAFLEGVWFVAHDLRNSFVLMASVLDELPRHLVNGDTPRRTLAELRWLLTHVDGLVTVLLEGLHEQSLERTAVALNEFIVEREPALHRVVDPGISLSIRLSPTSGVVLARSAELEQLLFALVAGACRAMPQGGDLTIGTGWLDHVAGPAHPGARPRRYVRLTISDTGEGLDRDIHTGLAEALSDDHGPAGGALGDNVVSVVRRLNGWLIVENEERAGARVHVCLPALADLPARLVE